MEAVINKKVYVIPALLEELNKIIPTEDLPDEDLDLILRAKELIVNGSGEKKCMLISFPS